MEENTLLTTTCTFCGEGRMLYNRTLSFSDFALPESFVFDDVDNIVDGFINNYLVYECNNCGAIEKLTFKEIEERERRRLSQLVMNSAAKGEIREAFLGRQPRVLIYCGKCNGVDGKGTCLLKVYKDCKIKRIPNEL